MLESGNNWNGIYPLQSVPGICIHCPSIFLMTLQGGIDHTHFMEEETKVQGNWLTYPRWDTFSSWLYDCLGVKVKLKRSQREEVVRGRLGVKGLLSWDKKNLQEAMIRTSDGLWPKDSPATSYPVPPHASKENMEIVSLWLYYLQSLLSFFQELYDCQPGAFQTINALPVTSWSTWFTTLATSQYEC